MTETAAAAIRKINPTADIITEHYTKKSDEWWRSLLSLPTRRIEAEGSDEDSISFSQLTLNNAYLNNPGELVALLEDCLHGDMGLIARAKGTIPAGSETLRFDLEKEKLLKRLGALFDAKKVSLTRAYVNRHQESQLP